MGYRIAAIGDLHIWGPVPRALFPEFETLEQRADVLVFTGDITNNGMLVQAERAAELLSLANIPIVAVMGNHDRRTLLRKPRYCAILERAGVHFLDGTTFTLDTKGAGASIGFAGVSGSGGGFWPDEGPDTGVRRAAQQFAIKARREAARLDQALHSLDTDLKVVVTHVAPTLTTLVGEPRAKFWLLGNSVYGRVIDRHGVDLVFHGHAHRGNQFGETPSGIPVCNVAHAVAHGIVIHELSPRAKPRLIHSPRMPAEARV